MGAGDDPLQPLGIDCRSTSFTSGSEYHKNLKTLLSHLQNKTPETGFAVEHVGGDPKTGHSVYGRAICRPDISSPANCKACVGAAIAKFLEICPLKKVGTGLYKGCMVFYTDKNIFHKLGPENYYIYREPKVSGRPAASAKVITEFVNHLTEKAIATKGFYAKGEIKLVKLEGTTLYGSVQCALDISAADCKNCVAGLIKTIHEYRGGKGGAQAYSATCILQYEFYRFFN